MSFNWGHNLTQTWGSIFRYLRKGRQHRCEVHNIGQFVYKIWDCPGIWCSDEEIASIQSHMLGISEISQCGKKVPVYGPLIPGRENLKTKLITIAYSKKTGEPAAFSAQTYIDLQNGPKPLRVTHLGLVYVAPQFQSCGVTSILYVLPNALNFLASGFRSLWISSVSQVPAVVGLVAENYASVFPCPQKRSQQTAEHFLIAREIMKSHRSVFGVGEDAEFDETTHIIRNAYTGGSDELKKTFVESPKHRNATVNEFCQTKLNYDRGDDVLQLGKLNFDVFFDFIVKKTACTGMTKQILSAVFNSIRLALVPIFRLVFKTTNPGQVTSGAWKIQTDP